MLDKLKARQFLLRRTRLRSIRDNSFKHFQLDLYLNEDLAKDTH